MSLIRKIFLYPFATIFDFLTSIRNFFFDVGIFKEQTFDYFSIGVGNISLGGTGKSVLVSYLAEILNDNYTINILSRGYGRESSGFQIANKSSTPNHLGDEPFMFYKQNQKIRVAVCNSRREGMSRLIESINKKLKNIFILDDLYQHRWVKPNIMILLTEYSKPYFKDYLFPSGNLRESRKSAYRADIIIVTKCPRDLSVDQKEKFISELNINLKQKVFFSKIKYNEYIFGKSKKLPINILKRVPFILVSGIADNTLLIRELMMKGLTFKTINYKDHFTYTKKDINKISSLSDGNLILTTEKDYFKIQENMNSDLLFYVKINIQFNEEDSKLLKNLILKKENQFN
ncbi:MAG: tetraacyldisaccharide 4'-kinase [Flavobacteriaceae bacterium]